MGRLEGFWQRLGLRRSKTISGAALLAAAGGGQSDSASWDLAMQNIERLRNELEADPNLFLRKTEALSEGDYAIIGRMIQNYCSSDFNARRAINAIRKASHGPNHQNGGKLQDKQVYEKLQEAITSLPEGDQKAGLEKAARTIALHHLSRHDFAHWVFRKVPSEAVYYFTSNNEGQSANRTENPIGPGHARYGLMAKTQMVEELNKLIGHNEYLAQQAVALEANHKNLKAHFDAKRQAEQKAKYEAAKARTAKRSDAS